MAHIKLDNIDIKILTTLQQEGRISNVKLSEKVGISPPPCLRRVRGLEKAGYINGYHADINMEKMGYNVTVFAFISLKTQQEKDLLEFSKLIDSWPMVRDSYMMAGDTDFILRIVSQNWEQYNNFLVSKLVTSPNVANVKSALGMGTMKKKQGIPLNTEAN